MIINSVDFVVSLGKNSEFFNKQKNEIAFVGRSNVGKSSLINFLCDKNKLARTSNTPGRTRLINYFLVNDDFYFVDLPGYGFAKGNKQEQLEWKNLMENYFVQSSKLKLICLLFDIRRDLSEQDDVMLKYLTYYNIPFIVILTKADKISKSQIYVRKTKISSQSRIAIGNMFVCSNVNKIGKDEILNKFDQFLNNDDENILETCLDDNIEGDN